MARSAAASTAAAREASEPPLAGQPDETLSFATLRFETRPVDSQQTQIPPFELQPGDWPGFRGPNRDSVVHGVKLATDWNTSPPHAVWRRRVGPAWSSFVAVGDRLFTQEQRGEMETVVCLAAETGQEFWAHEDPARFSDGQAGAGPRATPTFDAGRIYSFGATGLLNCLDAATGSAIWTRDVTRDCDGQAPMWGFSSSPLIVDGMVVVYAGGTIDQALLAYRANSGELAWKAVTGEVSYSSPQLASIGGQEQILFLSERGLTSVAPDSGDVLWNHEALHPKIWRAVQPRLVGDSQVLIGSEDLGLVLLDVAQADGDWIARQQWISTAIQPAFSDFVVHDGHAYGFDGSIFCCTDLATGSRRWKGGRYGHGQVLLLADQPLLVVLGETGEAVLLAARPDKHEELGRFQAIEGKTWNHPVIAHGRLYVRNDVEMACYALKLLDTK
jgi:outer membrane protein assembly factor BamB